MDECLSTPSELSVLFNDPLKLIYFVFFTVSKDSYFLTLSVFFESKSSEDCVLQMRVSYLSYA